MIEPLPKLPESFIDARTLPMVSEPLSILTSVVVVFHPVGQLVFSCSLWGVVPLPFIVGLQREKEGLVGLRWGG